MTLNGVNLTSVKSFGDIVLTIGTTDFTGNNVYKRRGHDVTYIDSLDVATSIKKDDGSDLVKLALNLGSVKGEKGQTTANQRQRSLQMTSTDWIMKRVRSSPLLKMAGNNSKTYISGLAHKSRFQHTPTNHH